MVGQLLSLKKGGLLVVALCCRSFSSMCLGSFSSSAFEVGLRSRATSGRSWIKPSGNEEYAFVREGNVLASRVALLVHLASSLGVMWFIEQPGTSILMAHPRINNLFRTIAVSCQDYGVVF